MRYINHYNLGNFQVVHKFKNITVSESVSVSDFIDQLSVNGYTVGKIPPGYEHRPDLISDLFYGTVTKDWVIVMFNKIKDPFQQLNAGDEILIPNL